MRIAVVKEIKPAEARVGLTPAGAEDLVRAGHTVLVERETSSAPAARTRGRGLSCSRASPTSSTSRREPSSSRAKMRGRGQSCS